MARRRKRKKGKRPRKTERPVKEPAGKELAEAEPGFPKGGNRLSDPKRTSLVALVLLLVAALALTWWWFAEDGANTIPGETPDSQADGGMRDRPQPIEAGPTGIEPVPDIVDKAVARAIEEAARRVREDPSDPEAHGELGRIYHAHKHAHLAQASYENARRLDPDNPDWPYLLALFAADRGDSEQAGALLKRVTELRPDYAPAWYHLAAAELALDRPAAAEQHFSRVVELAPEHAAGWVGMARVAQRNKRFEEAAKWLERALTLDSSHREAIYLLAVTRRELGQEDEAKRLLGLMPQAVSSSLPDPILSRALERRTDLEERNREANRLQAEGDMDSAESLYLEILESDPNHYDALYNLGLLYNRSARYQEAVAVLERSALERPRSADAHFLLAMSFLSLGRPDPALDRLEKALEIDSEHALARDLMDRLTGAR